MRPRHGAGPRRLVRLVGRRQRSPERAAGEQRAGNNPEGRGSGRRPTAAASTEAITKIDVEGTMIALARCRATKSDGDAWNLKPWSVILPLARDVWQKRTTCKMGARQPILKDAERGTGLPAGAFESAVAKIGIDVAINLHALLADGAEWCVRSHWRCRS